MAIFHTRRISEEITKVCSIIGRYIGNSTNAEIYKMKNKPLGNSVNITIYNSPTKRKTELISKEKGVISWYCCGPTVYDSPHLGHACCYINFDIIRRILEEIFHQDIIFSMGITDIDDKIINRANEEGVDFRTISQQYEKEFFNDIFRLNIKKPTIIARVTDYIPDIIKFIEKIIDNGFGYVTADGSVNFSVNKYKNYGIFIGAQEESNYEIQGKESNRDFALWKAAKPGEPKWSSPWGEGRPGWHIECSAIASKLFGNHLDIHSGGMDLKFPHHENEEAQCCVYHNVDSWVTHWIHTGHVLMNKSVKMSKSLKNTISIDDFLHLYTSDHLRMLCLMIPYRNNIDYGEDVMEHAVNIYDKCKNFINDCNAYIVGTKPLGYFDEFILLQDLIKTRQNVMNYLADDFDTSSAITRIVQFITRTNAILKQKNNISTSVSTSYFAVAAASSYIENFLFLCGFTLSDLAMKDNKRDSDLVNVLETSLQFRLKVRETALAISKSKSPELVNMKATLLTACDEFRNSLYLTGIELKDYGKKTSWNITNKMKNISLNQKKN